MAVRSKQLVASLSGGPGNTTHYTCPAAETTLLKHVNLYANTASAGHCRLILRTPSGLALRLIEVSLGAQGSLSLEVWWVLHPGDQIETNTSAANTYSILLSGAELEGVAD